MDATKYCQCKNSITASPCIVCGKPKFIDPAWLKRKIEEGEIGAGFELFPLPDDTLNDIAAENEAARDDEFNTWGEDDTP